MLTDTKITFDHHHVHISICNKQLDFLDQILAPIQLCTGFVVTFVETTWKSLLIFCNSNQTLVISTVENKWKITTRTLQ